MLATIAIAMVTSIAATIATFTSQDQLQLLLLSIVSFAPNPKYCSSRDSYC